MGRGLTALSNLSSRGAHENLSYFKDSQRVRMSPLIGLENLFRGGTLQMDDVVRHDRVSSTRRFGRFMITVERGRR